MQKLLGHTQIKTTQRYAHLAPETLLAASNAATQAVGSVMGVMPNRVVDVPLVAAKGWGKGQLPIILFLIYYTHDNLVGLNAK